mmetsp:Transcript_26341/g.56510  ORF Transcript_26341/g.56510 Transcript_26341/m.56510 type:complete len:374 (+) Transcript_26341:392-1513(+)
MSSAHSQRHRSYGTNTSWVSSFDSINQSNRYYGEQHQHGGGIQQQQQQNRYMYYPKCTDVPQFDELHNAAAEFHCDEKLHLRYLCNDTARCSGLTAVHVSAMPSSLSEEDEELFFQNNSSNSSIRGVNRRNSMEDFDVVDHVGGHDPDDDDDDDDYRRGASNEQQSLLQRFGNRSKIVLDYSRQQVTGETMEKLFDLADAVHFTERRQAFRTGERINVTEGKPVLHHVLRMPKGYDFPPIKINNRYVNDSDINGINAGSNYGNNNNNNNGATDEPTVINSCLKREQFVTVCGGNILDDDHLGTLVRELSQVRTTTGNGTSTSTGTSRRQKRLGATVFFHQHVIAILQLPAAAAAVATFTFTFTLLQPLVLRVL